MKRKSLAESIVKRIEPSKDIFRQEFSLSGRIPSFIVDDLLPQDEAREIYEAFPAKDRMVFKKSLREQKSIAAQMNRYNPLLEEIIYAFQEPEIVRLISEITGIRELIPDTHLYAGGISLMTPGDYLNPHIDNSHDKDRLNYRSLNLLYYVTPEWKEEDGGNLELWDEGVGPACRRGRKPCRTIHSRFNRLVVMATGKKSWHSVSPVRRGGQRCCVSNYYFSPYPLSGPDYFHVTSFRGRPEEKIKDVILQIDNAARSSVRKIFRKGIVKPTHLYEK
jgi:Rps23 Pro-64 3,4-dihydroxylase Tpa1-like proline 4-hydroxylase